MTNLRLWHGGIPGLRAGDRIEPGHDRAHHEDCPWCESRAAEKTGGERSAIDPLAMHSGRVYLTTDREYARHHRLPRGRGGCNELANLLLVCGSGVTGCHGAIERNRATAYDAGWLVHTGEVPAEIPLYVHSHDLKVYLSDDATYAPGAP